MSSYKLETSRDYSKRFTQSSQTVISVAYCPEKLQVSGGEFDF